ncbi:Nucleolin [Echinococcus granulosus]|uniref:Nucleolin n=1 Tax=Echinococcus granulosus TaxID=6210 RepID=W6UZZ4_ECHGR|nr:Nucleolin [Echinococcus granulosus]EUB64142.1 Nucleolin [Echinococcus granulosus]
MTTLRVGGMNFEICDVLKKRSLPGGKSTTANKSELDIAPPKSNEELRGLTKSVLLKGLSVKAGYVHFKKSLPVTPKNITLSTRFGQKNALLTFSTEEDCSKAFDTLESFTYDGQKPLVVFVRPRATVSKVAPDKPLSTEFCLDIANIPFFITLEQLKAVFPKAEAILMRCRKDGKFKGSCIAVFKSQSDYDEAEAACKEEIMEGRRLLCSQTTSEDCNKLLEEYSLGPSKGDREGLQIKLFNLPYGVSKEEIKKAFPKARNIFLPQDKKGNPTGIAILTFKTKAICQAALGRAKNVRLQGRRLRAEINVSAPKTDGEGNCTKRKPRPSKAQPTKLRCSDAQKSQPAKKPKLNLSEDDDGGNNW